MNANEQYQSEHKGWIKWGGGENPAGKEYVMIRMRSGLNGEDNANWFHWDHSGSTDDIVAYKYADVEEDPKPVKAKPGKWIKWGGDRGNPAGRKMVEIKMRAGDTMTDHADEFSWIYDEDSEDDGDIMKYRVVK